MEINRAKAAIQAILFAAGRDVKITELMSALEMGKEEVLSIMQSVMADFEIDTCGMEIIKVEDGFQMCSKKEYHEYIYSILDKRNKPNLSSAALETLAIIAYNPKITRAEIESIRGVNSDGTIYKLLEYNLIEEAGRIDAPGRPTTYRTSNDFLKRFGYGSLDELPELPKYKLDENEQIVIEDVIEEKDIEAPMPEREDIVENKEEKKEE